jgi:hypothetical protein
MNRKDFLKQTCGIGLCACTVASLFASATTPTSATPEAASKPATSPEDRRLDFARQRYAKLLTVLSARVDESTLHGVLEDVGRFCASNVGPVKAHAGDPDGFLALMKDSWKADVNYDRERGVVSLAFPSTGKCPCALVGTGTTPAVQCQCSLGWQKQAFETVFGRPVKAELKESLLRGGSRCAFEIRVESKPA